MKTSHSEGRSSKFVPNESEWMVPGWEWKGPCDGKCKLIFLGEKKRDGTWRQQHSQEMEMFTLIEPTWRHSLEHLAWAHQLRKESRKMKTRINKYIFLRGKRFKLGIWFSGIQVVQYSQVFESISTKTHTHTKYKDRKVCQGKYFNWKKIL